MKLTCIGSVDETRQDPEGTFNANRGGPSPFPPKCIVFIPREFCTKLRLRNATVALSLQSESPPIHAHVRIYSKKMTLFKDDACFPEQLQCNVETKTCEVVLSYMACWNLSIATDRMHKALFGVDFSNSLPCSLEAATTKRIMSLQSITLESMSIIPSLVRHNAKDISQRLSGSLISLNGIVAVESGYNSPLFRVKSLAGGVSAGTIGESTEIQFTTSSPIGLNMNDRIHVEKKAWVDTIAHSLGGLDEPLEEIVNHVYEFIQEASCIGLGSTPPHQLSKGMLITGRPGTGKSVLATNLVESSGVPYSIVNCPDIFQTDEGASERYLRDTLTSLQSQGNVSLLVLDEIDMIAGSHAVRKGAESKIYSTFLSLLDSTTTSSSNNTFVIGLTNRLHAVDSTLTRSGRLNKIYELGIKTAAQRLSVLRILTKDLPFAPDQRDAVLGSIAKVTHGFVPTDLQGLCSKAALILVSRIAAGEIECMMQSSFFKEALQDARPSGMGEHQTRIPTIKFSDLYGIDDAISELRAAIIEPFKFPQKYIDLGISPPRGVLVHGPPGVGKTMLCCALAEETGINFMLVEGSQIRSKVVGESEQNIAKMFAQAKANAPCILFIDQIDVLAPKRGSTFTSENSGDRIVTGLLTEMDGFFSKKSSGSVEVDVLVLAATNQPDVIDSAILRPGRLDQIVYIPAPDSATRKLILEGFMAKMPIELSDKDKSDLAEETDGYCGADLENLCREAALVCLREDIGNSKISLQHLQAAKISCKPSLLDVEYSAFSR